MILSLGSLWHWSQTHAHFFVWWSTDDFHRNIVELTCRKVTVKKARQKLRPSHQRPSIPTSFGELLKAVNWSPDPIIWPDSESPFQSRQVFRTCTKRSCCPIKWINGYLCLLGWILSKYVYVLRTAWNEKRLPLFFRDLIYARSVFPNLRICGIPSDFGPIGRTGYHCLGPCGIGNVYQ